MPERGPRDTSTGGGGGAPGEDRGPESGAEETPAESEPTRDESAAGGTEERAEEPREETPPAETPAPARETTPEAERGERVDWLEKVAGETKEREEAFYKEKYGEGRLGQLKKWLNETDAGKAVKIGTKIVAGTAAGITAGALTGGAGLLFVPALYGLGMKSLVDGGIEAASYLLKGRNLRIAIAGARADMRQSTEERFGELRRMHEAGEIDESAFAERVVGLTKEIAQKEKEVIQKETDRMKWEKKEAMVRAIASTVASVGVMCFTGIPLGVQNFNAPEASHAVRFTWRGFEFIYNSSETMAKTVHGLAFGLKTHALGSFGSAANALGAYVGLGAAAVGMFATTAAQLRAAKTRGEIPSEDPKYIQVAEEYKGRVGAGGPRSGPYGPTSTGGGAPGGEAPPPEATPPPAEEGAPPPEEGVSVEKTTEEAPGTKEVENPEEDDMKYLESLGRKISKLSFEIKNSTKLGLTSEELKAKKTECATLRGEFFEAVDKLGIDRSRDEEYKRWEKVINLRNYEEYLVEALESREGLSPYEEARLKEAKQYLSDSKDEAENNRVLLVGLLKKKRVEGAAPAAEAGGGEEV